MCFPSSLIPSNLLINYCWFRTRSYLFLQLFWRDMIGLFSRFFVDTCTLCTHYRSSSYSKGALARLEHAFQMTLGEMRSCLRLWCGEIRFAYRHHLIASMRLRLLHQHWYNTPCRSARWACCAKQGQEQPRYFYLISSLWNHLVLSEAPLAELLARVSG